MIQADLVAFLDADHIPMPNFLTHTLGYFDDPTVALVQTPADGPNRVIYGVQFCDGQTQTVGRLALANIWVEEAQAAPTAERPNGPQETGKLVWRPELLQPPQLALAPVEAEAVS